LPAQAQAATARVKNGADGHLIDVAEIPGGGTRHLQLVRYGEDYEILFDGEQLMGSWDSGSERDLADLVCPRLSGPNSRILIGGLGMGFTLGAARSALPADATIVVAELVPKVVSWAGGTLAHLFGESLSDPRVEIEIRDVHDVIVEQVGGFDAILLDVDNGPDGLIHLANERLYCNWGLRAAFAALRPGGTLAIWSAYPDDAFMVRLRKAGFGVEEVIIPAYDERPDADHVIWLATRPD